MTFGTNGNSFGHTVEMPGRVRDQLRQMARSAAEMGQGYKVTDVVARILSRLQHSPLEFGEPLYRLRKMRMEVRRGAINPVYVEYGVHDDAPLVVIRRVVWLAQPHG